MSLGFSTAYSALNVAQTALSVIGHNLANAATVGYKRDLVIFEDLLYQIQRQPGAQSSQNNQVPSGLQLGTGVRVIGTQKQFTSGNLQVTDQPLDMAINGRGFFEILQPNGTTAYTRNGEFHLSADGEMVTADGLVLQPAITIPQGALSITIGKDGTVSVLLSGNAASLPFAGCTLLVDVTAALAVPVAAKPWSTDVRWGSPPPSSTSC